MEATDKDYKLIIDTDLNLSLERPERGKIQETDTWTFESSIYRLYYIIYIILTDI